MRAIVAIHFGRLAGRRAIVDPGTTLRVGRTNAAALGDPADRRMSPVHFEIGWDGERCHVADAGSATGTQVNGERVERVEIANGDWIRAGDTVFTVHFEGATPPRDRAQAEIGARAARVLAMLREQPDPLFAIVDASRADRALELLQESVDEHRSLYEGIAGQAMAEAAPYLVSLRSDSALLDRLVAEGWEECWAVYLSSGRPFKEVRTHLRRFLMVEDDAGEKLYFRFYDPRVLRVFLPACTAGQARELFGEIGCFLVHGRGGELVRFTEDRLSGEVLV